MQYNPSTAQQLYLCSQQSTLLYCIVRNGFCGITVCVCVCVCVRAYCVCVCGGGGGGSHFKEWFCRKFEGTPN